MHWDRVAGGLAVVLVAALAAGAIIELGTTLFDHGGVIPTAALVGAVVVISARIGTRNGGWLANPYW